MLRRKIQRAAFATNCLGYFVLFGVVIVHVVHRFSAANVSGGDDGEITFWFEGPQEGDDQPDHHRPFQILNTRVLLGAAGVFLVSGLCDVGGIAGAGLFVPLFCLVVGFGLKAATGLAQAAISGVSLASLLLRTLLRPHPWDQYRTLIDLDLVLLLLPALLLGVTVGVMLNDLLPCWFINALLVAILMYVCHRKVIGGLTVWDEESQHEMNVLAAAAIGSRPMPRLKPIAVHISHNGSSSSSAATTPRWQQQQQHRSGDLGTAEGLDQTCCGSSSSSFRQVGDEGAAEVTVTVGSDLQSPPTPYVRTMGGSSSGSSSNIGLAHPPAAAWQQQQQCWSGGTESNAVPYFHHHHHHQQQQQQSDLAQPQVLQQQQQQGYPDLDSNSSSSSDQRASLLLSPDAAWQSHTVVNNSSAFADPAAAAAAAAFAPRPLPPLRPAAAAAAERRLLSPSHSIVTFFYPGYDFDVISCSNFPGIKFCSVCTLWLGFLGLSALDSLIPLCSWYYIYYMMLFSGITVLVTVLLMNLTVSDVASWNRKPLVDDDPEVGMGSSAAAAAAAAGGWFAAVRSAAAGFKRGMIIWINVLTGADLKLPKITAAAAAATDGSNCGTGSPPRVSLFKQALLQQHKQELAAAAATAEDQFPCIGAAAAATAPHQQLHSATVAAAAAAAVAGAAGIASGVCGVAGGALLTPVLLDFRVHPQVAAATSVLLVFMSSSGAVLSFIMQGRLVVSYAVLFWCVSVLGACVGVGCVGALVRKMQCRASVVILLLAALVGVACVSSAVFGVEEFVRSYQEDEGLGFRALCSYT